MSNNKKNVRVRRELDKVMKQPPAGISLCSVNDNITDLRATIIGVAGTPYESGVFKLDVTITDRYPYEPPLVRFNTPVYHPNIDNNGRICLELLKLPPSGCWRPVITIEGVLLAIQTLLGAPNPDDPLMDNIARQYRLDKQEFEKMQENTRLSMLVKTPVVSLKMIQQMRTVQAPQLQKGNQVIACKGRTDEEIKK